MDSINEFINQSQNEPSRTSSLDLKKLILDLSVEATEADHFVKVNKEGFRKILKKYEKMISEDYAVGEAELTTLRSEVDLNESNVSVNQSHKDEQRTKEPDVKVIYMAKSQRSIADRNIMGEIAPPPQQIDALSPSQASNQQSQTYSPTQFEQVPNILNREFLNDGNSINNNNTFNSVESSVYHPLIDSSSLKPAMKSQSEKISQSSSSLHSYHKIDQSRDQNFPMTSFTTTTTYSPSLTEMSVVILSYVSDEKERLVLLIKQRFDEIPALDHIIARIHALYADTFLKGKFAGAGIPQRKQQLQKLNSKESEEE
ncbi:MAG: hypothetical protein EZS28_031486, partial [Streblomastix strix]